MSDDAPILVAVADRIATVTLNRPAARNALTAEMRRLLPETMLAADASDDVDVVILTGADPGFCAGLDLKELGEGADPEVTRVCPFPAMTKPVIGAVNGVAVTGGLEIALRCDFIVASERARFADTHSRVGVMPGWGLTVLLPQAVGLRRAREMSFTGNFVGAAQALEWGMVNHVVAHEELLPAARQLAADICTNDQPGLRQLRATYQAVADSSGEERFRIEHRDSRAFQAASDPAEVERRRAGVMDRGRAQS